MKILLNLFRNVGGTDIAILYFDVFELGRIYIEAVYFHLYHFNLV